MARSSGKLLPELVSRIFCCIFAPQLTLVIRLTEAIIYHAIRR
jgi:hypothetical protein